MKVYPRTLPELRDLLHSRGINMRYLGVLARHVRPTFLQCLLLTDMIQRVAKGMLRDRLRTIGLVRLCPRWWTEPPTVFSGKSCLRPISP